MHEVVSIFADGGCIQKNPSIIGGTWAWCQVNNQDKRIAEASGLVLPRISLPSIPPNLTEFIALVKGLASLMAGPRGRAFHLCLSGRWAMPRRDLIGGSAYQSFMMDIRRKLN